MLDEKCPKMKITHQQTIAVSGLPEYCLFSVFLLCRSLRFPSPRFIPFASMPALSSSMDQISHVTLVTPVLVASAALVTLSPPLSLLPSLFPGALVAHFILVTPVAPSDFWETAYFTKSSFCRFSGERQMILLGQLTNLCPPFNMPIEEGSLLNPQHHQWQLVVLGQNTGFSCYFEHWLQGHFQRDKPSTYNI